MKYKFPTLSLLIALIVCGCTRSMSRSLNDIESYIQDKPDSALAVLQTIDTLQIKTKSQKALYSLLSAMAKDKNDIVMTDIRLIEPAVSWYKKHPQDDHLTAALFYSGRIYYCAGDYPSAIINYRQARENAKSIYWKGMCECHMSMTYNQCYNNEDELKHALESCELWKEYGDPYRIQQSYSILAAAYNNNRISDKADSLLALLCDSGTPFYPAFRQRAEQKIRWDNPDYHEISTLFETAINQGCAMSVANWYEYAYALFKCGDHARSESIISQLSTYDESISSCLWLGRIAEEKGNDKLALQYERTEKHLTGTIVRAQLSQSLFKAQSEQDRLNSEIASQKKDMAILFAILIVFGCIAIVLWTTFAFRKRRMRLEDEKEHAIEIAEKTSELLYQAQIERKSAEAKSLESENKLSNLRKAFAQMYQRQFAEIGRLFDYCNNNHDISEKAIKQSLERTASIIEDINRGEDKQHRFESRINQDLDNIMIKLRNDFPEFKESDFRFLSYVIVGFDATTRAIILNETQNNMRVRKARLIKKISNTNTENSLLYSAFLHTDR